MKRFTDFSNEKDDHRGPPQSNEFVLQKNDVRWPRKITTDHLDVDLG